MIVFFAHLNGTTAINSRLPMFLRLDGYPAVWLFFMLSSFLLSKGFFQERFGTDPERLTFFYKSRALRLLPLILCVQIVDVVLNHILKGPYPFPVSSWLHELFIISGPWAHYYYRGAMASINSPIWSVMLEIDFIIILPLLIYLTKISIHIIHALFAIWFLALLSFGINIAFNGASAPSIWPQGYESHLYNCGFFFAGISLAYFKEKVNLKVRPPLILAAALLCLMVYGKLNIMNGSDLNRALVYGPLALVPLFAFLMLVVDTNYQKRLPRSFKELRPKLSLGSIAESIGVMSYSFYLSHRYMMKVISIYLERFGVRASVMSVVIMVFCLTLSCVLYIFVENRFRLKKSKEQSGGIQPAMIPSYS